MKKKVLLVSLTSFATLVTSFAILAATRGEHLANSLTADKIQPGTITIDVNDENINANDGYNTIKSAAGNDFGFYFMNMHEEDGLFKISSGGELSNDTIINGITELRFVTPGVDQEITIEYKLNNMFWEYDTEHITVVGGGQNYLFGDYNPGFFRISNYSGSDFSFSRLTICYECTADIPNIEMSSLGNNGKIGAYQISTRDCLFGTTDSYLSNISLDNCYINLEGEKGKDKSLYVTDEYVSNLAISYKNQESNTILEGSNDASISFDYRGVHYSLDNLTVFGYDHLDFVASHVDVFGVDYFKYQADNNTIPDGFTLTAQGEVKLYNSSDVAYDHFNGWLYGIPLTFDMIVSSDSDRFTGVGEHQIIVSYQDRNYGVDYEIYNPAVNNIRYLSIYDNEVMAGTTTSEFIDFITNVPVYVEYYENDYESPSTIYLTAENLDLTEGMFDDDCEVFVPVHYSTFDGSILIYVKLGKGNLVKTYTNDDGVYVFGTKTYKIALYDNGVCEINPDDEYNKWTYNYVKDGSVLVISSSYEYIYKIRVDDIYDTFERYIRTDGLVMELTADLSALGFDEEATAYIYNDDMLGLDVDENFTECPFTADSEDENVIYFSIEGGDYIGTIDSENGVLIVTMSKHLPDKEGPFIELKVDLTALHAPQPYYDGYLYEDGTLFIDLGMLLETTYERSKDNENIIRFNFMGEVQCVGTIDPETNIMVVTVYFDN